MQFSAKSLICLRNAALHLHSIVEQIHKTGAQNTAQKQQKQPKHRGFTEICTEVFEEPADNRSGTVFRFLQGDGVHGRIGGTEGDYRQAAHNEAEIQDNQITEELKKLNDFGIRIK